MEVLNRNEQIIELARDGSIPMREIAARFGLSVSYVNNIRLRAGLRRNKVVPRRPADRNIRIQQLREAGLTLEEIGGALNLTRERVRQVIEGV